MIFDILFALIIGTAFFAVGLYGIIRIKEKKWLFFIAFILGSWVIHLYTLGPLSKSKENIQKITLINPSLVNEISIKPTTRSSQKNKSFVEQNVKITNIQSVKKICKTLNSAKWAFSGYIKNPEWLGQLEIKTKTDTFSFGVQKKGNLTGLEVYSDGEYGWNYGTLKCDNLGQVLEEEIRKYK